MTQRRRPCLRSLGGRGSVPHVAPCSQAGGGRKAPPPEGGPLALGVRPLGSGGAQPLCPLWKDTCGPWCIFAPDILS